jgi:hypothetical protein
VGEDATGESDSTRLTPAPGAGGAGAPEISGALASGSPTSGAPAAGALGVVAGRLAAKARVGVDADVVAAGDGTGSTLTGSTLTAAAWGEAT